MKSLPVAVQWLVRLWLLIPILTFGAIAVAAFVALLNPTTLDQVFGAWIALLLCSAVFALGLLVFWKLYKEVPVDRAFLQLFKEGAIWSLPFFLVSPISRILSQGWSSVHWGFTIGMFFWFPILYGAPIAVLVYGRRTLMKQATRTETGS